MWLVSDYWAIKQAREAEARRGYSVTVLVNGLARVRGAVI